MGVDLGSIQVRIHASHRINLLTTCSLIASRHRQCHRPWDGVITLMTAIGRTADSPAGLQCPLQAFMRRIRLGPLHRTCTHPVRTSCCGSFPLTPVRPACAVRAQRRARVWLQLTGQPAAARPGTHHRRAAQRGAAAAGAAGLRCGGAHGRVIHPPDGERHVTGCDRAARLRSGARGRVTESLMAGVRPDATVLPARSGGGEHPSLRSCWRAYAARQAQLHAGNSTCDIPADNAAAQYRQTVSV